MYALRRVRGLGDDSALPKYFGMTVDCSNPLVWGLFTYLCGQYSPEAWREMRAFQAPPAPAGTPAVGAGTSTVPAPYACDAAGNCPDYTAALTAAALQQSAASSENLQAWAAGQSPVTDQSGGTGLSTWAWVGLGLVGVLGLAALGGGSPRRYGR